MDKRRIDVQTQDASRRDGIPDGEKISASVAGNTPVPSTSAVADVSPVSPPARRAGSAKGHYILAEDFDAPLFDPEDRA